MESNKDPFLFDVIKLLRPDPAVRLHFFLSFSSSFFPKHGGGGGVAIRGLQMSATLSSLTAPRSLAGSFFLPLPPPPTLPPFISFQAPLRRWSEDEENRRIRGQKCCPHLFLLPRAPLPLLLLLLLLVLLLFLQHSNRLLIFPLPASGLLKK